MVTWPFTVALGMVSCMRLRQRTKVDLPQPEGPMMAVTWRAGISRVISWSAWVVPNQALSSCTRMPGSMLAGPLEHAPAGCEPYKNDGSHNGDDQDQRSSPGHAVPLLIGRDGIGKNLQGQSGSGLIEF